MRRYLVVANQTLGGEHLIQQVREYVSAGPSLFHVLVPATPSTEHLVWTEGEAQSIARGRLERAVDQFRDLGAEADGEVADANPLLAIEDVLRNQSFDEIILSTLPAGPSRWLKLDLPARVEKQFGLPVTHVVAEAEPAREET
jgi:hypothetical protein